MITLSLLKLLEDNNLGRIDEDLFWQKLGLGKIGVYIVSIGQSQGKAGRRVQKYELYARGNSDLDGLRRLERIIAFLNSGFGKLCTLPSVPEFNVDRYQNVTIMPLSTPTSMGVDKNDRLIWAVTGEIRY